jgi:hypothetical protein
MLQWTDGSAPFFEQVVSSSTIYTISIIYLYLYYLLILIKSFILVIQPLFLLDPYSAPWYRSPPHDRLLLSTFTYLHPSAAAELPPPSRSESISAVVATTEVAAHRVLLPPGAYCLPPTLNCLIKNGWIRLIATVSSEQYSSYIVNNDLIQYLINSVHDRGIIHTSQITVRLWGKADDPDPSRPLADMSPSATSTSVTFLVPFDAYRF